MIKLIIRQLVNSPFYPHWLEFYKRKRGDNYTLRNLKGKIIEVGAGDGSRKYELVKRYKKIEKYISTDYSSWNSQFEKRDTKAKKFWGLSAEFFKISQRLPIDKICSALDIPYKESTFDYHLSFEVLEHVENPNKFFKEASRVVKKGGYIILSVPFLYKIHGGEPNGCLDYFRYTYGFFNEV
ncbi:MAG: methyltransferase domain-containing protein, partial [Candidatus Levybacteria bacterium]|nr:methyltransferase domain-containing protein [Candidatus Levybacteria bacterium]